eukprot:scaffold60052_cov59-Phaeocystis_antarctica.AAC.11
MRPRLRRPRPRCSVGAPSSDDPAADTAAVDLDGGDDDEREVERDVDGRGAIEEEHPEPLARVLVLHRPQERRDGDQPIGAQCIAQGEGEGEVRGAHGDVPLRQRVEDGEEGTDDAYEEREAEEHPPG